MLVLRRLSWVSSKLLVVMVRPSAECMRDAACVPFIGQCGPPVQIAWPRESSSRKLVAALLSVVHGRTAKHANKAVHIVSVYVASLSCLSKQSKANPPSSLCAPTVVSMASLEAT